MGPNLYDLRLCGLHEIQLIICLFVGNGLIFSELINKNHIFRA